MKTNKLIEENKIISTQLNIIEAYIKEIQEKQEQFDKKIQELERQELKRVDKEKHHDRQILIRDLFSKPKERLYEELERNNLSETQMNIFLKFKTDTVKLSSDYPLLYLILQIVSKEFDIDPVYMLNYLKEKRSSNKIFHLNADLIQYACVHTNYDLKQFMEKLNMHSLDEKEYVLLQPVFINICQIINRDDQ